MEKTKLLKLLVSLILPIGLGSIAGLFTAEALPEWFASLNKPPFNPPNWIFGPVWTTLYILLGISFFLIWQQSPNKKRNFAILVSLVQLLFNFGWSFIFFYYNMIFLALIEIILLWISIVIMLVLFYRIKPLAAYLNVAYLLWVTFAATLNAGYYILNRS